MQLEFHDNFVWQLLVAHIVLQHILLALRIVDTVHFVVDIIHLAASTRHFVADISDYLSNQHTFMNFNIHLFILPHINNHYYLAKQVN